GPPFHHDLPELALPQISGLFPDEIKIPTGSFCLQIFPGPLDAHTRDADFHDNRLLPGLLKEHGCPDIFPGSGPTDGVQAIITCGTKCAERTGEYCIKIDDLVFCPTLRPAKTGDLMIAKNLYA